jgi:cytochrome oxidase Cu insertion factor (SCO1/SenC/PrrC family)
VKTQGKRVVIQGLLIALLVLPFVAVTITILARDHTLASRMTPLPMLGQVPEFSMIEANGKPVHLSDLRGRVWMADFIFTHCAGQCPRMTHGMAQLQMELPKREDWRLVSVSVDPERDTPEVLTKYADMYGADRSHWLFLTGNKTAIRQMIRNSFRMSVEDNADSQDEPILHSSKIVLVDRDGLIRGYYDGTERDSLKQLVEDVSRLLAARS